MIRVRENYVSKCLNNNVNIHNEVMCITIYNTMHNTELFKIYLT
jgi:hypothetical protein